MPRLIIDKIEEYSEENTNKYNFFRDNNTIDFLQTDQWAKINKLYNSAISKVVTDSSQNKIMSLFSRVPDRSFKSFVKRILRIKNGTLITFGGPILEDGYTKNDVKNFLINLKDLECKSLTRSILIYTPFYYDKNRLSIFSEMIIEENFVPEEVFTNVIDLRKDESELFSSFRNAARTGYRKCQNEGITHVVCKNFGEFQNFTLSRDSIKNVKFSKSKDKQFWDSFSSYYNYFYTLSEEGEILSLLGTYSYQGVVTPVGSMVTHQGIKSKLPAQDFLFWEVMKYHKKAGDSFFQFTHSKNEESLSEKEKNIKRFKLKFNGEIYKSYIFSKEN